MDEEDFISKEELENYFLLNDETENTIEPSFQELMRADIENPFLSQEEKFKLKVNLELDKIQETGRTKNSISSAIDTLDSRLKDVKLETLNPELTVKILLFRMKPEDLILFSRRMNVDPADLLRYNRFMDNL
jgi:hypothetical protein